jgi:four helix bundle protein
MNHELGGAECAVTENWLCGQKAIELVVEIYRVSRLFPKSEVYGLASQMRRAAVSVPSNIAEGQCLKQTAAYLRHLSIASGSVAELETQIEIADRLRYLLHSDKAAVGQACEVGMMLSALRKRLQSRNEALNRRS